MNRQDIPSACAQRTSTGPPSPREDGLPKAKLLWLQSHSIVTREAHLKSHLKVLSHLRLDVGDDMAANPANLGLLPLTLNTPTYQVRWNRTLLAAGVA